MAKKVKGKVTGQSLLPGLGTFFQERRLHLQLSLQDVSKKSGITYLTISKLERGQLTNCSVETLAKIANALGLELQINSVPVY